MHTLNIHCCRRCILRSTTSIYRSAHVATRGNKYLIRFLQTIIVYVFPKLRLQWVLWSKTHHNAWRLLLSELCEIEWLQRGVQAVKRASNTSKHSTRISSAARVLRTAIISSTDIVKGISNIAVDLTRYWALFDRLLSLFQQPVPSTKKSTIIIFKNI